MTMPGGQEPGYPQTPPPPAPSYPPPGPGGYQSPPPGPASYAQPAPPPKPTSGRRTGLVILATLGVLIVVIVGGLALFRDRITGDVGGLKVGDCIDRPSNKDSVTDVQHQPCTDPHDGEVFAVLTYPGADGAAYPGDSAFDTYTTQQCDPALVTYTSRTADELAAAGMSYGYFYPTSDSWSQTGDRGVTCFIHKSDYSKMVGSVKAAAPATTQ